MYKMMPRREIPYCNTKLAECPDIIRSLVVIETCECGVDPYMMWCAAITPYVKVCFIPSIAVM